MVVVVWWCGGVGGCGFSGPSPFHRTWGGPEPRRFPRSPPSPFGLVSPPGLALWPRPLAWPPPLGLASPLASPLVTFFFLNLKIFKTQNITLPERPRPGGRGQARGRGQAKGRGQRARPGGETKQKGDGGTAGTAGTAAVRVRPLFYERGEGSRETPTAHTTKPPPRHHHAHTTTPKRAQTVFAMTPM